MYMAMGRTELAQTYFGRVLLLDPGDKRALEYMERLTEKNGTSLGNLVPRLRRRQSRWQRRKIRKRFRR